MVHISPDGRELGAISWLQLGSFGLGPMRARLTLLRFLAQFHVSTDVQRTSPRAKAKRASASSQTTSCDQLIAEVFKLSVVLFYIELQVYN